MIKFLFQLFFPILALASLWGLYVVASYSIRVYMARNWVPVEAKVLHYDQALIGSARGNLDFSVEIEYEYFSKGAHRIGNRLSFLRNVHTPRSIQKMLGDGEPTLITVYVDPRNPSESVVYKASLFFCISRFIICILLAVVFIRLTIAVYSCAW